MEKWDGWLTKDIHKKLLISIEEFAKETSSKDRSNISFKLHEKTHYLAVEKMIKAFVNKFSLNEKHNEYIDSGTTPLSEYEILILFLSVWTHDLGMFQTIAEQYFATNPSGRGAMIFSPQEKVDIHEKISAWFLGQSDKIAKIFSDCEITGNLFYNMLDSINIISKFHVRANNINYCPEFRGIHNEIIRTRLLASLLRLGNTFHVDSSSSSGTRESTPPKEIRLQMWNFDRVTRMHWLRSHLISAVYLDNKLQQIQVFLDFPDYGDDSQKKIRQKANQIASHMTEDFKIILASIEHVFVTHNLRFYHSVFVQPHFCPGFSKVRDEIVRPIIDDIDILLYPNSSQLISSALESTKILTNNVDDYSEFEAQIRQLIAHFNQILKTRSCHIGLRRLINILSEEKDKINKKLLHIPYASGNEAKTQHAKIEDALKIRIDKFSQKRKKQRKNLFLKFYYKNIHTMKVILLFGYSDTVLSVLSCKPLLETVPSKNSLEEKLLNIVEQVKRDVYVFVFEQATRRAFTQSNKIEYNDGIHYADRLADAGYKNIFLFPDVAIASLIEILLGNEKTCAQSNHSTAKDDIKFPTNRFLPEEMAMLFGANAIDHQNRFIHSSGHLTMSIIAKEYGIKCYVLAESSKKETDDDHQNEILTLPIDTCRIRTNSWLTGQEEKLNDLKSKNINAITFAEDCIAIDESNQRIILISDDGDNDKINIDLVMENIIKKNTV